MRKLTRLFAELATESTAFSALVASISLSWKNSLLLFVIASAEALLVLTLWHDRNDVCFFLVIGAVGSLAEIIFVQSGVWNYANPDFLGITAWFPVAFGTAALVGQRLVRTIVNTGK
jgi:hypothetical protein